VRSSRPSALERRSEPSGLDELVIAVRDVVSRRAGWQQTARLVADALERHLPTPDVLTAEQRVGDPTRFQSHLLHTEPDGTFSIVALVWRPGQVTAIHDHVTWCAFGVIQGVEREELFTLDGRRMPRRRWDQHESGRRRERLRSARRHPSRVQPGRRDRDLAPHLRDRRLSDRLEHPARLRSSRGSG
jgi:predicted metal-dependent enzyme (double-stranded beta helix superfamily)